MKSTLENLDFQQDELTLIRNWRIFQTQLKTFRNKCTPKLLQEILEESEENCIKIYKLYTFHPSWEEFEKCLTTDWRELILRYILRYCKESL